MKIARFVLFVCSPIWVFLVAGGWVGNGGTEDTVRADGGQGLRIATMDLGPLGTGTNFFRTGLAHSSGVVYLGTYGPAPALVWKYDPATQQLTKLGAPGEYQLDSMVEAPDGKVFIGTAY